MGVDMYRDSDLNISQLYFKTRYKLPVLTQKRKRNNVCRNKRDFIVGKVAVLSGLFTFVEIRYANPNTENIVNVNYKSQRRFKVVCFVPQLKY